MSREVQARAIEWIWKRFDLGAPAPPPHPAWLLRRAREFILAAGDAAIDSRELNRCLVGAAVSVLLSRWVGVSAGGDNLALQRLSLLESLDVCQPGMVVAWAVEDLLDMFRDVEAGKFEPLEEGQDGLV